MAESLEGNSSANQHPKSRQAMMDGESCGQPCEFGSRSCGGGGGIGGGGDDVAVRQIGLKA